MKNNQLNRLLEFSSIQMASEAFLLREVDNDVLQTDTNLLLDRLREGNTHASKFMPGQAQRFVDAYEVLAQFRNDPLLAGGTGFSATLFKRRGTEEYTLSFRSTEFLDDPARDTKATNELEIKQLGWAFGQIAVMEDWYKNTLRAEGGLLQGKEFSVTGYSLGGHLATAFNILRREEATATGESSPVIETYTFNGAGVGAVLNGRRLTDIIADFNRIRDDYATSAEWTALSLGERDNLRASAQMRIDAIVAERTRVGGLPGLTPAFGASGPAGSQILLGYQIAALLVGRDTRATNFAVSDAINSKLVQADPALRFANVTEVVGMETDGLATSFVSNSGIHYGTRQEIAIEAQPTRRGTITSGFINQWFKLLVDYPGENDFGDTHSLVLLVDSLSLMAAMERLAPELTFETARQIFAAMSSAAAASLFATQGTAEGDTLERTLDALRAWVIGPNQMPTGDYRAALTGNTWHLDTLREPFHNNLAALNAGIGALRSQANAQYSIQLLPSEAAEIIRRASVAGSGGTAYRYALRNLNPFVVVAEGAQPTVYDDPAYARYDADAAPEGLTINYLTDRAAFLSWKILKNTANLQGAISLPVVTPYDFVDRTSGYEVKLRSSAAGGATSIDAARAIFGSDQAESGAQSIQGGSRNDRLYGGGGDDTLTGNGGNDYLEGNTGDDRLDGGDGNDILVGGVDGDELMGGKGNDFLYGGAGNDVYRYAAGDGDDTIVDGDGSGQIVYSVGAAGYVLTGGRKIGDNLWQHEGAPVLYRLFQESDGSATLNIFGPGGRLFVKSFDAAANP